QIDGAPWFEWNGTDLLQFGTPVVGANVTAQVVAVEALAGLNWIGMDVTASGGSNDFVEGVALPISATPPTADYAIVADFVNIVAGGSNEIGAVVLARYDGADSGYGLHVANQGAAQQESSRWNGGIRTAMGPNMSEPNIAAVDQGARLLLSVRGTGTEALIETAVGKRYLKIDTAPIVSVGKAGLLCTTNGVATQVKNLFRNIRCYSLVS
ncbi:MAG: hypothetical protein ACYTF8_12655, partial [Planctomycetota bacterium]